MPWTVTLRVGSEVRKERFAEIEPALDALREHVDDVAAHAHRGAERALLREYEPVQQVAARGELRGPDRVLPRVRAGADVRGDGSVEAWTGWLRRRVVQPQDGEAPIDALRRVVVRSA